MTYHTNHCWCSKSNWNGECFDGEVMVYFGETLSNDFLDDNKIKDVKDPDWKELTLPTSFVDEEAFKQSFEAELNVEEKVKTPSYLKKLEDKKERIFTKDSITLKPEIIEWLNENILDNKLVETATPIHERKAWAIGNNSYNSNAPWEITVFFARQLKILKLQHYIKKIALMIIYNITVKINPEVHDEWLNWMKTVHMPNVMLTERFQSNQIAKVLGQNETDGITYAIQYVCADMKTLHQYTITESPALEKEQLQRYPDKFVLYTTLLEIV